MFVKEDLDQYKMFKSIMNAGDFQIKGNAVIRTASLIMWYDRLEKKIEDALKEKSAPKIKQIKGDK